LLQRCPTLRAVTSEDPAVDAEGALAPACRPSFARLAAVVDGWLPTPLVETAPPQPAPIELDADSTRGIQLDQGLEDALFDSSAARTELHPLLATLDRAELTSCASRNATQLFARAHVGVGSLRDAFAAACDAWCARNPHDGELSQLAVAFFAREGRDFSEGMCVVGGRTVEECFADFAQREGLLEPSRARHDLARAIARTLVVVGTPAFQVPREFRACPGGTFAVIDLENRPPALVAALGGRFVEGPITELVATLLRGEGADLAASRHGAERDAALAAQSRLHELGLL